MSWIAVSKESNLPQLYEQLRKYYLKNLSMIRMSPIELKLTQIEKKIDKLLNFSNEEQGQEIKAKVEEKDLKRILLEPTPIAHRMLMTTWSNLSIETQAEILLAYADIKGPRLKWHWIELTKIALDSPYPLIRYLGSKLEGSTFKDKVRNDPCSLVSASNLTFGCDHFSRIFKNASSLASLSQEERIEQLSYCSSSGGALYSLICELKDKSMCSEKDLWEMIFAYLTNPYVKAMLERPLLSWGCGLSAYRITEDRDSLWKLILLFPEQHNLSEFLPNIPDGKAVISSIINELIYGKHWLVISSIFNRKDIKEKALRSAVYNECSQAVYKMERNRFFGIKKGEAALILNSCEISDMSLDELYDSIPISAEDE